MIPESLSFKVPRVPVTQQNCVAEERADMLSLNTFLYAYNQKVLIRGENMA
jgi:hypothetical protein